MVEIEDGVSQIHDEYWTGHKIEERGNLSLGKPRWRLFRHLQDAKPADAVVAVGGMLTVGLLYHTKLS